MAGTQVVQLYTHQCAGSNSRPVRELRAFRKVALAGGDVQIGLPIDELSYWSSALHRRVPEPVTVDICVGSDSNSDLRTTVVLRGSAPEAKSSR